MCVYREGGGRCESPNAKFGVKKAPRKRSSKRPGAVTRHHEHVHPASARTRAWAALPLPRLKPGGLYVHDVYPVLISKGSIMFMNKVLYQLLGVFIFYAYYR